MSIRKIFLGTSKPLSELAAARLLAGSGALPDLGRILIAVPGNQARMQLQDALVRLAPNGLLEPQIITPGVLMHCGMPEANIPDQLENELIWNNVAEKAAKSGKYDLLFPAYEKNKTVSGTQFSRLRLELAAGGLSFADAAEHLGTRAEQLCQIEQLYFEELETLGFTDCLAADLEAAENVDYFKDFDKIILCGIVDVPVLLKKRIRNISETWGDKLETWIFADRDKKEFFDFSGSAIPEKWNNCAIDIPDFEQHVHCVESPEDAADKLIELISKTGEFIFDDTAIVLAAPSMFPVFKRKLSDWAEEHGTQLDLYDPSGIAFSELRLHKLGCALLNFCNDEDIALTVELIRNNDMLDYFAHKLHTTSTYLLRKLDDFILDVLPAELQNARAYFEDYESKHPLISDVFKHLDDILERYKTQKPAEFLREFFTGVYRHNHIIDKTLYRGVSFTSECNFLQESLRKLENGCAAGIGDTKKLLEIFWKQLGCEKLPYVPGVNPLAVEGCLELPFLSEKNIFLCGVNAEYFPDKISPTIYLTDSIRKKCGIRSNQDTFARAAAHLYSLCSPSECGRNMQMIAMKKDAEGAPLLPSPLFFTGALKEDELVLRSRVFFKKFRNFGKRQRKNASEYSSFTLRPVLEYRTHPEYPDIPVMPVTAFQSYISNPLDYFINSVMGMEEVDYFTLEPDGKHFGTVVHAVFERLGTEVYHTAAEYNARLQQLLNEVIREQYGKNPSSLLEVVRENMSQRLDYVAEELYGCSCKEHYIPLETEYMLGGEARMLPLYITSEDKPEVFISGKIDRIEYSPETNTLRVVDFKTGNAKKIENIISPYICKNKVPVKIKLTDLQMPLYAELLLKDKTFMDKFHEKYPHAGVPSVCCAYIVLPKNVADTKTLKWSSVEIEEVMPYALQKVKDIIDEMKLWKNQEMSEKGAASKLHKNLFLPDVKSALRGISWIPSIPEEYNLQ